MRLSFPKPGFWIFAWVALLPLFLALENRKPLKAFLLSFICGAVFFITTVFWLVNVTAIGMVVLALYLALYVALFGLIFALLKNRFVFLQRMFYFPAVWVSLEFARGHFFTGMPWALLGNGQAPYLLAIQAADIVGAYGVSFMVVFVNLFIFELLAARLNKKSLGFRHLSVCICVILLWFGYGAFRLSQDPKKSCYFRVAVIQGNIPQEIKWVPDFKDNIFRKHCLLTEIVSLKEFPDMVVWPETSYPNYLTLGVDDQALKEFASSNGVPLLAGSITLKDGQYFNSAILFSEKGEITGSYDKIHLVPFGEFIPWRRIFPFLASIVPIEDFTRGRDFGVFPITSDHCPRFNFSVLICFEDIFGDLARRFVLRGSDVLINMTNDAWFEDSSSPYQHMQASVLRAVENRTIVVRAANTGVSCFIDDTGRVYKKVSDAKGKPVFVTGYASAWIYKTDRSAIYTRIGDVFALICVFYAMIIFAWGVKSRR